MFDLSTLTPDPWAWPELTNAQISELAEIGTYSESPFCQYYAVRQCLDLKARIEAGDGFSTLEAVRLCGNAGLKMPLWLSHVFNRKYMAVVSFQALSWDAPESFGRPYPKGTNKAAKAKKRRLAVRVYLEIKMALKMRPNEAVSKALFEEAGSKLGLGATLAEEYYYSEKKKWEEPGLVSALSPLIVAVANTNPANIPKVAGLRKRPK